MIFNCFSQNRLLILCLVFSIPLSSASLSDSHAQSETPVTTMPKDPSPSSATEEEDDLTEVITVDEESSEKDLKRKKNLNRFLTTGFIIINAILFGVGFAVVKMDPGTKVTSES